MSEERTAHLIDLVASLPPEAREEGSQVEFEAVGGDRFTITFGKITEVKPEPAFEIRRPS